MKRDVLVLTGRACSFSKVSPTVEDHLAPSRSELLSSVASIATYRSLWYGIRSCGMCCLADRYAGTRQVPAELCAAADGGV